MVHGGDDPGCNHKGRVSSILENIKNLANDDAPFRIQNPQANAHRNGIGLQVILIAIKD
jgi:hypothetical protein